MRRAALLLACLALALPLRAGNRYEHENAGDYLTSDTIVIKGAPFTVSIWASLESFDADGCWAWYSGDDPNGTISDAYWLFAQSSADIRLGAFDDPDNGAVSAGVTLTTDTWHHIGFVEASTSSRDCWADETHANNTTTVDPEVGEFTHMYFGRRTDVSSNWFDGDMGVAAFWDEGLADEEMSALHEGAWPPHVSPESLTFLMDQGNSNPDQDVIGGAMMTKSGGITKAGIKPVGPRPGQQAGQ